MKHFVFSIILSVFYLQSQGQVDSLAVDSLQQQAATPDSLTLQPRELSLLFVGDIMGHQSQINAAFDDNSGNYRYDSCFKYIAPVLSSADVTIANLEVTLAGWPYQGYPQFSSPDELAVAMKNAGVDVMVTANNHSCDRRQQGVERTIDVLDSLDIAHTGTFVNAEQRERHYPLIIEKNGFKIALLNYTYATNGIPATAPNIVNLIQRQTIINDLEKAKSMAPDHIIVFMHWGKEYEQSPSKYQTDYYQLCRDNGADLIIGSHPHVVQRMELNHSEDNNHVIAYSLGNFISNQRTAPRDGGALIQVNLKKENGTSTIQNAGYYLTWVYPPRINGKKKFYVLPASQFEVESKLLTPDALAKMKAFTKGSRLLFDKENIAVDEYKYDPDSGQFRKPAEN